MNSVSQVFAVLTKQSTNFLFRKYELIVHSNRDVDNESDQIETAGTSEHLERGTNTTSDDAIGNNSQRTNECVQRTSSISSQNEAQRTQPHSPSAFSLDSIRSIIFDKVIRQLENSDDGIDGTMCRICYGTSQENLLPICQCRGSIAHVHVTCMERWLQECGSDSCDLCQFKFITERKPMETKLRSFLTWLRQTDNEMQEMWMDLGAMCAFFCFTLLMNISSYQYIFSNSVKIFSSDVPNRLGLSLTTVGLCSFVAHVDTIVLSWLCYIGLKHYARWHSWYRRRSMRLRIVLPDPIMREM